MTEKELEQVKQSLEKERKQLDLMSQFSSTHYAKLRKEILQDLNDMTQRNNIFLKKYPPDRIRTFLLNPDRKTSQKALREISRFFYAVSPHYRRLISFFANLTTDNYYLEPSIDVDIVDVSKFRQQYLETCLLYNKYRLKNETPKIRTTVFIEGVFYGVYYESKDSFIIRKIDSEYAEISSHEDGVFRFSFDLNYFNGNNIRYIQEYGTDFIDAYNWYKGNPEKGIEPHKDERWFEPKNQICVKYDEELLYSIPPFCGLFTCIADLDVYKEIKKDKVLMDNYRLINLKIQTDSDGIPKMNFDEAKKYYGEYASNVPDGIGVAMSPFDADNFTLKNTDNNDNDYVEDATKDLFSNAGLNPLLFGLGDNPTSQTLDLSTRPDEALVFKLNKQIANVFNVKMKKTNPKYYIMLVFLEQSIFNKDKISDALLKSSQYGCPTKLLYVSSVGISPSATINMSMLENDILGTTTKIFNHPLISSNTLSGGQVDSKGGRPIESDGSISDSTELGRDNNTENR